MRRACKLTKQLDNAASCKLAETVSKAQLAFHVILQLMSAFWLWLLLFSRH
jgi:hypothetical protein